MTASWAWAGTAANHATAPSPAYPSSGVDAGQQVLLAVLNKPDTAVPDTPSGWTPLLAGTGGSGTEGSDTGPVRLTVFGRVATGSEASSTVAVSVPSGNGVTAVLVGAAKTLSSWLLATGGVASDTTSNTTLTATAPSNIGIASGDLLLSFAGLASDSINVTASSTSAPGATVDAGTERIDFGGTAGEDNRLAIYSAPVSAGTSTGAATITFTISVSAPGAVGLLRLRDSSNTPPTANAGPDQLAFTGNTVTLDGTASSDPDGTIASYSWSQLSGPAVTLSSTSAAQPTFTPASVGAHVFGLVVTDNGGDTSLQDTVTISVALPAGRYHATSGAWTYRRVYAALSGAWV